MRASNDTASSDGKPGEGTGDYAGPWPGGHCRPQSPRSACPARLSVHHESAVSRTVLSGHRSCRERPPLEPRESGEREFRPVCAACVHHFRRRRSTRDSPRETRPRNTFAFLRIQRAFSARQHRRSVDRSLPREFVACISGSPLLPRNCALVVNAPQSPAATSPPHTHRRTHPTSRPRADRPGIVPATSPHAHPCSSAFPGIFCA